MERKKINELPWLLIRKPFSIAWKHGSCNLKEHPRGRGVERRKLMSPVLDPTLLLLQRRGRTSRALF
jgi:hypothetical protein